MTKKNTKALAARPAGLKILGSSFRLQPAGLTVISKPTIEEYTEAFKQLELVEGAIHWWYGDLALSYEKEYGLLTDLAELSPFIPETIQNDKWIASRYETSSRDEVLTFTHHRIAAPLADRLEWLGKAKENNWSTRQLEAEIHKARRLPLPEATFSVIYADPPWEYEFSQSESRSIEAHYPTMATEEICQLPIPAAESAVLFLWTTSPKLREALKVIEEWGFEYRTNMVWVKGEQAEEGVKKQIGMGYYCREQHELLLVSRKGEIATPDSANRPGSVIITRRTKHSRKPEEVYEIIEHMYPNQSKIELFARNIRPGWSSWGLEVEEGG